MPPATEARHKTIVIDGQCFGMLLGKPDGRRGGGGAEDHIEIALPGQIKAMRKPIELKDSRARLHFEPGEFRHVNDLQPHGARCCRNRRLPLISRPLLGVIVNAYLHTVSGHYIL